MKQNGGGFSLFLFHLKSNTMADYKYEYYCKDCEEDFMSTEPHNLCGQCLGSNITGGEIEKVGS